MNINCPNCENECSQAAPACPKCGHPFGDAPVATVAAPPAQRASGCQKCGASNWKKWRRTTGLGWGLFVVGLLSALFTFGLGLMLCVLALFLTQRGWKCRDCGYSWTE